jgi:hypothetical protein
MESVSISLPKDTTAIDWQWFKRSIIIQADYDFYSHNS